MSDTGFRIEINGVVYDVPRDVEVGGGPAIALWLDEKAREALAQGRKSKAAAVEPVKE